MLNKLLPYFIAPIYYLIVSTWRIREYGPSSVLNNYVQTKNRKPCLYAFWHGDELVLVGYYAFRKLGVLSSLSKDGDLMAKVLSLLGYQVFRGSSSRAGARGLLGLIRYAKKGGQASLAVDGPKGPIYQVKPGIIELALKSNLPIIPLRTFAKESWPIPKAWNRSYLPKPFTLVDVVYDQPVAINQKASITENTKLVKSALDNIANPDQRSGAKKQVVAAIIKKDDQFLVAKRAMDKGAAAGYWCPVSGCIENDESPAEAVVREVKEETDLTVEAIEKVAELDTDSKKARIHWWTVKILSGEAKLNDNENDELRWVTISELQQLSPIFEQDVALMKSVIEKENN